MVGRQERTRTGQLTKKKRGPLSGFVLGFFFQTRLIIQRRPSLKNRSQDAAAAQQVFNLAGWILVGV